MHFSKGPTNREGALLSHCRKKGRTIREGVLIEEGALMRKYGISAALSVYADLGPFHVVLR